MNGPPRADRILERGARLSVEFAVRANGRMEAKEWLDSQPPPVLARFNVLFRRLVTEGRITNKTQFRYLDEQVWEFKRGGDRLVCCQLGSRYLLTHHFAKSGRKSVAEEIERAKQIASEEKTRERFRRPLPKF